MAVMMPRERWTDERLDDLQAEMRQGFARVDAQIERLDGDIKKLRQDMNNQIGGLRGEMNARFEKVDERFEALNRNLVGGLFVIVATILGSNAF
jgi:DNA anti-recombination protein RmuC